MVRCELNKCSLERIVYVIAKVFCVQVTVFSAHTSLWLFNLAIAIIAPCLIMMEISVHTAECEGIKDSRHHYLKVLDLHSVNCYVNAQVHTSIQSMVTWHVHL